MDNNNILSRIRFIFDFSDQKMIDLFALGGLDVTREQVCDWLRQDEDYVPHPCDDTKLAAFLNGLIIDKRGRREGEQPEPENVLTNNMIFMKLKIALNLKAEEVLDILEKADFHFGKHELSAFFRKPGNKHYRECKDQVLRYFLNGLKRKYRKSAE